MDSRLDHEIEQRKAEIVRLKREIARKQKLVSDQKHGFDQKIGSHQKNEPSKYHISGNSLISHRARQRLQQEKSLRSARYAILKEIRRQRQWEKTLDQNAKNTDSCDRITINNNHYSVSGQGARLIPVKGAQLAEGSVLTWHKWTYLAGKSGVLKRTNGSSPPEPCRFFSRTGICGRGSECRYIHDVAKIQLCRQFLAAGCSDSCLLSHNPTQFNTPICWYSFGDKCTNGNCRYSHELPENSKNPKYTVWTCRPFAVGGYCGRGSQCPFAHLFNCPDYEENGSCPRGASCSLTHTASKHVQAMMSSSTVEGVLVSAEEKVVVSSYTVEPEKLFVEPAQEFVVDSGEYVINWTDSEDETTMMEGEL